MRSQDGWGATEGLDAGAVSRVVVPEKYARWVRGAAAEVLKAADEKTREAARRGQVTRKLLVVGNERSRGDRLDIIVQVYADLWRLGFQLVMLESLSQRHLKALCGYWKAKPLAKSTLRARWSVISNWTRAIGKAGMCPRFGEVWGDEDEQRAVSPETMAKPRALVYTGTREMPDWEYRAVVDNLKRTGKLTTYYLVRAIRELGLKREEALLMDPRRGVALKTGYLEIFGRRGMKPRAMALDSEEKRQLVEEMQVYLAQRGRSHLGWEGLTLELMLKRYSNNLGYQRRLVAQSRKDAADTGESVGRDDAESEGGRRDSSSGG